MRGNILGNGISKSGSAAILLALVTIGFMSSAQAQFGGGRGPRLAPEKAEAAWTAQAKCVAKDLKLSDDASGKLTEAYKAARKSFQTASEKLTEEAGGDRMAVMQGMMELRGTESGKLETALKGKLDDAQLKGAMASLGSFNPQWDSMVDTLTEFKLEDKKSDEAMKLVKGYVEGSAKATNDAIETMDFQSLRDTMQTLKGKLDADLKPVLSEAQLAQWMEKTTRRREGGGPGGPVGPGGAPVAPKPPSGGANPAPKSDK